MKTIGKSYSFFISALISLFSFVFAIAIALTLFAHAKEQSYLSESKTIALALAQDIIEEQKMELKNRKDLDMIRDEALIIEDHHKQIWNLQERWFRSRVKISGKDTLMHIQVEILGDGLDGEEKLLVSMDTDKFIGW